MFDLSVGDTFGRNSIQIFTEIVCKEWCELSWCDAFDRLEMHHVRTSINPLHVDFSKGGFALRPHWQLMCVLHSGAS